MDADGEFRAVETAGVIGGDGTVALTPEAAARLNAAAGAVVGYTPLGRPTKTAGDAAPAAAAARPGSR
ncbi:MAG: hypothetical protein ACK4WH_11260 [Phycisphaerales bacterium]